MNISLVTESGMNLTMYARTGKKVWISEDILREVKVGDINDGGTMSKTGLYNQSQYQLVNAKSWADKAYVMNEVKL